MEAAREGASMLFRVAYVTLRGLEEVVEAVAVGMSPQEYRRRNGRG